MLVVFFTCNLDTLSICIGRVQIVKFVLDSIVTCRTTRIPALSEEESKSLLRVIKDKKKRIYIWLRKSGRLIEADEAVPGRSFCFCLVFHTFL